jgi:hypothetical protein
MTLSLRRRAFCLVLAMAALISCTEHTQTKPNASDLIGKYKPADLNDPRLHADSEIDLQSDGTCQLIDYPYVEYESHSSSLKYLNTQGTWAVTTYGGYWHFEVTVNGTGLVLNLLHNAPPYQISQEGEDVDDDILFFNQTR